MLQQRFPPGLRVAHSTNHVILLDYISASVMHTIRNTNVFKYNSFSESPRRRCTIKELRSKLLSHDKHICDGHIYI